MRKLPEITNKIVYVYDGWIIGSAANPQTESPRDIDIIVSYNKWQQASLLIPQDSRPNSFGGWKFLDEGIKIDVWPGDLAWILQNDMVEWIWQPRLNVRYNKWKI